MKLPGFETHKPLWNAETEKACLGSMLQFGEMADVCRDVVQPEHFQEPLHQVVCRAIYELRSEAGGIDPLVVANRVQKYGRLTQEEAYGSLMEIVDSVPHPGNAERYAREVHGWWVRRGIWERVCNLNRAVHNFAKSETDLVAMASDIVETATASDSRTAKYLKESVLDAMERLDSQESGRGINTGYYDCDEMLGGLRKGTLTVIAARPGTGKTSMLCKILLNVGALGAVLASLEMPEPDITDRLMAMKADVPYVDIRNKKLEAYQRDALATHANPLAELPVLIDDKPGRTVAQIEAICRRHSLHHPLGIVLVDYLQLVAPENRKDPRELQVASVATGLKELAKRLAVPVLALCQLNREVEKRENKSPRLSDIRESGGIENAADAILFLDRPFVYNKTAKPEEASLDIAKNRNGPTGKVSLVWDGATMTFKNAAPEWQEPPLGPRPNYSKYDYFGED